MVTFGGSAGISGGSGVSGRWMVELDCRGRDESSRMGDGEAATFDMPGAFLLIATCLAPAL